MRTEVCITIDTEFSIAGAFADPSRYCPEGESRVRCRVGDKDEGLGFILRALREFGLTGTFFIEVLNTQYFGEGPMGSIVEQILSEGHDVQLHLHPCWLVFRDPGWQDLVKVHPPDDKCEGRSLDEMCELIELGLEVFGRWGAPRPVALRAGGFSVDRTVYRAMAKSNLPLASNIGTGYAPPHDPSLILLGGRHWIESVLEVPILTYSQFALGRWQINRLFAITATSSSEAVALLWAARRAKVSPVVIISHPFEFVKNSDDKDGARRNRVNQARLAHLCKFVVDHPNDFVATTFAGSGSDWLRAGSVDSPSLQAPLIPVLGRIVENKLNDFLPFF